MIRIGSQLLFCSPEKVVRRMVVEFDEQNTIKRLFSLDDGIVEPSHTLFFDGILSSGLISLRQNIQSKSLDFLVKEYNYFDLSENHYSNITILKDKPLILDFGITMPDKINSILPHLSEALSDFSIFEIIAACTYYPSKLLGMNAGLTENVFSRLILWENVDLINKKLTAGTHIREMN